MYKSPHKEQPLKILLVDKEYQQYLLLKRLLAENRRYESSLYWCGEQEPFARAIHTGIYDLVLVEYSLESLLILEDLDLEQKSAPTVLMADHLSEAEFVRANTSGVRGYLSRKVPDSWRLDRYLLLSHWCRKQTPAPAFIPGVRRDPAVGSLALR